MENESSKNTIHVQGHNLTGNIDAEHVRFTLVCTQGMLSTASDDPDVLIRVEARLLRELHLAHIDEKLTTEPIPSLSDFEDRVRQSRTVIKEQIAA